MSLSEPAGPGDILLLAPGPLRRALAKLLCSADESVIIELAAHAEALCQMAAAAPSRDHYLQATLRARRGKIRSLRALMSLPGR